MILTKKFLSKKRKGAAVAAVLVFSMLIAELSSFPAVASSGNRKKGSPDDSLVLHYTFDDEKNPGLDSSGNGNNGKIYGNVKSCDGIRGKAVLFDSSTHKNSEAYIELPKNKLALPEMTFMAWVKFDPETVGSFSRIFAIETSSGAKTCHLMTNAGSPVGGYKSELFGGTPKGANMPTEGMIPVYFYQSWHHVAFTYDGQKMKLFINGAFVSETDVGADMSEWQIKNAFIGKTAIWNDGSYNGYMDDVRIYSKALSESQICSVNSFSAEEQPKSVKLLSSLSVDGKELDEFDAFLDGYVKTVDDDNKSVPRVSAVAPFDDSEITVKQATSIPGRAEITVKYSGGAKRTVTVDFVKRSANAVRPDISDVVIDDSFWNEKLKLFSEVTAPYVIKNWVTQHHSNFANFDKVARGDRNTKNYVGGMTWGESDFYASLAGACRLLRSYPNDALRRQIDECVDHIYAASQSVKNGYFSIYNLLMTDGKVFSEADKPSAAMDLFNLGYLIEFGIAYYDATGDARMLRVALRFLNFTVDYSDHGKVNFVSFHTGVEYNILALCEWLDKRPTIGKNSLLSDLKINRDDYFELAHWLLAYRGVHTAPDRVGGKYYGTYSDDHIKYTELTRATGHSVVATLYYYALSEMGRLSGDNSYTDAACRLWRNITEKQMYVTGGTGSVHSFEGFGGDYYLPNESYCETCSSGALLQLSDSLSAMFVDSVYADNIELELYNNLLGGIGANGNTFFYLNSLYTTSAERWSWHGVPCCTKYGLLVYGQLGRYIYSSKENNVYVDQCIGSKATLRLPGGDLVLKQMSDWQWNGKSTIIIESGAKNADTICLRIPSWSDKTSVTLNGKKLDCKINGGYAVVSGDFSDGDKLEISADVSAKRIYANENVEADRGRTALRRGVFIYCIEGADNKSGTVENVVPCILLDSSAKLGEKNIPELYGGVVALTAKAKLYRNSEEYEDYTITAIPFYARANRGANPVSVWIAEKKSALVDLPVMIPSDFRELKKLGAKYTGITNALNPTGGGSKDISVIVDGDRHFSTDKKQYDSFGARLNDDLGKNGYQWFGVKFDKNYLVSYVIFYEGGQWNDGGWFGSGPKIQVLSDGKWTDVETRMSPEYPADSASAQLPANEAYTFIFDKTVECSAIRVVGAKNSLAGHASCAEIEVYGMNVGETPIDPPKTTAGSEQTTTVPTTSEIPTVTSSAPTTSAPVMSGESGNSSSGNKSGTVFALCSAAVLVLLASLTTFFITKRRKKR